MSDIRDRMLAQGLERGLLVELELKDNAKLDNTASVVPSFLLRDGSSQGKRVVSSGYVATIDDKYLGLLPVWDRQNNQHPSPARIGGINYHWDAIEDFRIHDSCLGT